MVVTGTGRPGFGLWRRVGFRPRGRWFGGWAQIWEGFSENGVPGTRSSVSCGVVGLRDSGRSWFGASVDPRGGGLDPLHQGQSPLRSLLPHSVVLVTVQQRDMSFEYSTLIDSVADLTCKVQQNSYVHYEFNLSFHCIITSMIGKYC